MFRIYSYYFEPKISEDGFYDLNSHNFKLVWSQGFEEDTFRDVLNYLHLIQIPVCHINVYNNEYNPKWSGYYVNIYHNSVLIPVEVYQYRWQYSGGLCIFSGYGVYDNRFKRYSIYRSRHYRITRNEKTQGYHKCHGRLKQMAKDQYDLLEANAYTDGSNNKWRPIIKEDEMQDIAWCEFYRSEKAGSWKNQKKRKQWM